MGDKKICVGIKDCGYHSVSHGKNECADCYIEALEAAIKTVIEDGSPLRPPDRMDKCAHDCYGWENCENCIVDYLQQALEQE